MLQWLSLCLDMLQQQLAGFLVNISLHNQLSLQVFLDGGSLAGSTQQEHIIELFERPVQEEYEVTSKVCEAAVMNGKKEVAAVVKEKSALQQQLKVN